MDEAGETRFKVVIAGEEIEKYGLTAESAPTIILDPSNVPPALRHLIPLAEHFGVSDDIIRRLVLDKTPADELAAMTEAVIAVRDELDLWLCGPESYGPDYSEEYIAFSCLNMAAEGC